MEFNTFESIKIGLASPEQIRNWSYGVVERPETINYRTQKPEKDGLFCEKIFGPTKDWECHCGKFKKIRFKGKVCDRCGVEVTRAKVRRERMGHIELAAPVSHIWYFKGTPSRIGQVLEVSQKRLEEILYFTKYIVTDPGNTELEKKQLLTEKEYIDAREKYGDDFKAGMGAESIKVLLEEYSCDRYDLFRQKLERQSKLNLDRQQREQCANCTSFDCKNCELCANCVDEAEWKNNLEVVSDELKDELDGLASGQKRMKLLKRLEIIESFRLSGNKPEWMVLDVVPVIPPELRPMVMLDGGRYATSDLNDLYRRVINRNNRLKRMLELDAPDIIIRNEKRMLQEAVDALIDNGRHGRAVTGPSNRALKSLSDMLKGKQGRFRQNLLGKRVDYSGRSVIVVGPELKMYQCGLPKEMALELFKPFVLKRLVDTKVINNIKGARKMVDRARDEVWDALENVIKDHPVLLNRAPTLHRLGIQAFEPVLVEGRALKLHPLVCTAYNADFDGDQMAVHLPLSQEAPAEARFLMLAANNLLKPSDGRPVAVPTQDMVLGSYYLTMLKEGEKGEGKVFRDVNEALMAYQEGVVSLHAAIKVRITKDIGGRKVSKIIDCTVGRLIFNENIPQNLGYVDRTNSDKQFDLEVSFLVGKKQLSGIIERCIKIHGTTTTSEVLDKVKALGFKYSTKAAITVAVCDAVIPPQKKEILSKADEQIDSITELYDNGYISSAEKSAKVIEVWNKATNDVTSALKANLDKYNPIFMMADSGARGSINQIRQLAGMRGLIANTSGTTIEIPIRANYREGLNILEYFISSRGARKGLADTALRTADSGYLTRRLVDVSQDVIIRAEDCGAEDGIEISEITSGGQLIEGLDERLLGRYLVEDLRDEATGELILSKNKLITEADAQKVVAAGVKEIKIRSVIHCKCKQGVCAKCYGANLANGNLVSVGEAVGIIAAQSIGEPGTQLTMRTFHTGGIASAEDITQGLPRVEELFESRKPKKAATIARTSGKIRIEEVKKAKNVYIINEETGEEDVYVLYDKLKVKDGDVIAKGHRLTEGNIYPVDILNVLGPKAVQDYIIKEVQKVYRLQGVDINDKHIEVIVRQMLRKIKVEDSGSSYLLPASLVDKKEIDEINAQLCERMENGEENIRLITTSPVLQGITKASSSSESFLSAASFQETTKALTDAAIKGKSDMLLGLKENVIIGKLVPAGTGMDVYNKVEIVKNETLADQQHIG
ncbi:MAG: DNA-directed RNA polymerase subunit beta' [Oscillospiraceae bacterium]|nr:DNA-directed RNA polymerase subunit beta' [Oscillospiraceae bacterium]